MLPGERFMKTISFEQPDRVPVMDFGYWRETIDLWHKQGLPMEVDNTEQVEKYFGLDRGFETNLVNYWGDDGPVGIMWREFPNFSRDKIEETDTTILYGGECGLILESKVSESMPHQMKFPIETIEDLEAKLTGRLNAWDPGRVTPEFEGMLRRGKENGEAVGLWIDGFFAWPREIMGIENLSIAYFEDPELVHAIQRQHLDFIKEYVKMVLTHTPLQYACVMEDMAFNSGSLISKDLFHRFMTPYYEEMIDFLHSQKINKVLVDSDGNTLALTDLFVEVGIDGHYPCEIKAGAIPEEIRKKHPRFALIGGISKYALETDRASIDKELSKIPALLEQGGYIPAVDHRVHPQVPMANYQYYVEKKREIIEKFFY